MHANVKNLIGQTFSRLTVIDRAANDNGGSTKWLCKCVCGSKKVIGGYNLVSGDTKSCGCFRRENTGNLNKTHGMYGSLAYRSWRSMKNRCLNTRDARMYKEYGGKGITICPDWMVFENFYKDMGPRPSVRYSIDRIDNDGNYEPENCRWATREQQSRNRGIGKNNKSGIVGVYQDKSSWRAAIRANGTKYNLYQGPDFFEACCARKSAENRYWNDD